MKNELYTLKDNIRANRKRLGMTQEQLAAAMEVSVGAVSKWESGQSLPELAGILALAKLFGISTDALIGYTLKGEGENACAGDMDALLCARDYAAARSKAPDALLRYPNSFPVVVSCAKLYFVMGLESQSREELQKALELYERASALFSRNTDEGITQAYLQNRMGETLGALGETDRALEILRANNTDGVNNASIAHLMVGAGRFTEAGQYLTDGFIGCVSQLIMVCADICTCCTEEQRVGEASEILQWVKGVIASLEIADRPTYLGKVTAMLLVAMAQTAALEGDWARAERCMGEAASKARAFDAAPRNDMADIRFCKGPPKYAYDNFGMTAMGGIRKCIEADPQSAERLGEILGRLIHNEEQN